MKVIDMVISKTAMLVSALVLVSLSTPVLARADSGNTSDFSVNCVRALSNPSADKVDACSAVSQEFGVECVAHWGDPSSDAIRMCGQITSRDAADCVNALQTGSIDKIRACASFDNAYAPRCVKEWRNPSSDMVRACGRIANPYALACIDALTSGNSDIINACASIKDQAGLDCLNSTQVKTSDRVRHCSFADSLPDTNIDCVHCSAEQKEQNIKTFKAQLDAMNAQYEQLSSKAKKALDDNGFVSGSDLTGLTDISHCIAATMKLREDILNYEANRDAIKVNLAEPPACTYILSKYDAYLSTVGH